MMLKVVGGTSVAVRADRVAIIIPAHYGSSSFPGKPLVPLRGAKGMLKSLIQRSWEAARLVGGFTDIWIATDDLRIAHEARSFGAQVVDTPSYCRNDTERCWAAVREAGITAEIIVHLRGDSPLTPPLAIELMIDTLRIEPSLHVVTPMIHCTPRRLDRLTTEARLGRVRGTTVVCNGGGDALYFSKQILPYGPEHGHDVPVYVHVAVYAYRRAALQLYAETSPSPLEIAEGLEQLRFLHYGVPVRLIEIPEPPGGTWQLNTPSDVGLVEAALAERHIG